MVLVLGGWLGFSLWRKKGLDSSFQLRWHDDKPLLYGKWWMRSWMPHNICSVGLEEEKEGKLVILLVWSIDRDRLNHGSRDWRQIQAWPEDWQRILWRTIPGYYAWSWHLLSFSNITCPFFSSFKPLFYCLLFLKFRLLLKCSDDLNWLQGSMCRQERKSQ